MASRVPFAALPASSPCVSTSPSPHFTSTAAIRILGETSRLPARISYSPVHTLEKKARFIPTCATPLDSYAMRTHTPPLTLPSMQRLALLCLFLMQFITPEAQALPPSYSSAFPSAPTRICLLVARITQRMPLPSPMPPLWLVHNSPLVEGPLESHGAPSIGLHWQYAQNLHSIMTGSQYPPLRETSNSMANVLALDSLAVITQALFQYFCQRFLFASLNEPALLARNLHYLAHSNNLFDGDNTLPYICDSPQMPYFMFLFMDDAIVCPLCTFPYDLGIFTSCFSHLEGGNQTYHFKVRKAILEHISKLNQLDFSSNLMMPLLCNQAEEQYHITNPP
ncbi:hypothetical protein KP509_27G022300 [Ceratopteris richardii]|uniref:Uncharacterized protein n=1 Tax=Ceratopteris richardii TaxID=49495 RepID=A0A8T2REL9_CERRI|nr:hypothetical protein KP509_27G022300 [Ceratopteris richardii]